MSFGVRSLSISLDDVEVLHAVDLDVAARSVVAVVGGDGAGKSTLLRCLVGKLAPASGEVHRPARHLVGYMPSTSGTWRQLTVAENIDFVGRAFRMSASRLDQRRTELLHRAKLNDAADRLAGQLSGGMRQKLGFVLAMLHEPELLVLDEPSTGVDPVSRVELWRLIADAAAAGTAVAMATTYLDEAERASSVSVLDDGRVIAAGTREDVMASCPGFITAPRQPAVPNRTWRRKGELREWHPNTDDADVGRQLLPDALEFEDVVIARLLADRLATPPTAEERAGT
jgi:ABC-2 type transport system ATP-binding protein